MNWKTKDGKILKLSEMTDSHLTNSIRYKEKNYDGNPYGQIGGEIATLETEKNKRIRERFFDQKAKCMCGGDLYVCDTSDREVGFSLPRYAWKCRICPFTSCEIKMPKSLI